jgi:hypothetical protein
MAKTGQHIAENSHSSEESHRKLKFWLFHRLFSQHEIRQWLSLESIFLGGMTSEVFAAKIGEDIHPAKALPSLTLCHTGTSPPDDPKIHPPFPAGLQRIQHIGAS